MSANVLELRGYGVAFGARTILRDVSFFVPAAGCTVLLGPSGTGKSTLLRTLAGYNRTQPALRIWGEALYDGAECGVDHHPSLVMQSARLMISNVRENLVCDLPGRSRMTKREQMELLESVLAASECTHLLGVLDRNVAEQPIADQRIISVLRQAIAAPKLLMVDEPTAGLPPEQADKVLRVMEQLGRRHALLVVLHNMLEAKRIAQQVVLLASGRVQEQQHTEDFFRAPTSQCGCVFVRTGSCPEAIEDESVSPFAEDSPDEAAICVADEPAGDPVAPLDLPAPVNAMSAACGPRGFVWLMPGQLAGTPWPGVVHGANYDLQSLRHVGVTHLVSLTEEPFPASVAAGHGIECHAFPMPDMHPPSLEQAIAICRRIDQLLAAREVVAVHCHAGLGRTGTVLACYWLWRAAGRLSGVKALEDVRRLEPGWVQSMAQVQFLERFADVLADPAQRAQALREGDNVAPTATTTAVAVD